MERRVVNPWTWQDSRGFSQAIEVAGGERVLYCAGQTSVDGDGRPLHAGDMQGQLGKAIDNLETVLREAGFEPADIVRLNVYVTDLDAYFPAARAVGDRLGSPHAATLLEVSRLALPELLVEIEATAVR